MTNRLFIILIVILLITAKDSNAAVPAKAKLLSKKTIIENALHRRLKNDLNSINNELYVNHFPHAISSSLKSELAIILHEIPTVKVDNVEAFKTIFPINDLHRRIFTIQAKVWRAMGFKDVVVWPYNQWDMLSPTQPPIKKDPSIDIFMMQNEYRSAVFNLSNPRDTVTSIKFAIEGLPSGINPKYISVYKVLFTDTKSNIPVAVALQPLSQEAGFYILGIPSGMTTQIWLTFHPTDTLAGEYQGRIVFQGLPVSIPLHLKIYPIRFTDKPALHLSGWDYTDHDKNYLAVTSNNRESLIKQLQEHFVDSPWASNTVLSSGKFNSKGKMIQSPNPIAFRHWLDRWPHASNYYVASCFGNTFDGFPIGTPAFQNAVTDWINWWVTQLKQWGVQPKQLGLLLFDEPDSLAQDNIVIQFSKIIHRAQPGVIVWEDPMWENLHKSEPELFEVSQVLSPRLSIWIKEGKTFRDFYIKQRQKGKELWFYSCDGLLGRLLDPYSYYRLQAWFAWKYGAKGESFWSFSDTGDSSSWNEYTVSDDGAFTPLFIDDKSVTNGKHMEAIREGIEDYEYFRMLSDKIKELQKRGVSGVKIVSAQKILNTATDRVINANSATAEYWRHVKDRTIADQVRKEILEILTQLNLI